LNWLAHVFLSTQSVEFRLGNLLADVVRGTARQAVSREFARGAYCHQAIDAFTDAHPLVRCSRERLGPAQRRFSGVIVDVFYDHFLATEWPRYAARALEDFTSSFYRDVQQCELVLPQRARTLIDNIVRYDLLGSYGRVQGVERSLRRLSIRLQERWQKEFALEASIADLEAQREGFAADFAAFFPALQLHVESNATQHAEDRK
jgi:acyl carrier protein phosphodiesterase